MITVRTLLGRKGSNVWSISPDSSVLDALKLMAEKDVGALLVVKNDKIVGVISERDYARKVTLAGKNSKQSAVKDIMSTKVYYVTKDQKIDSCMAIMTEKAVRHLPVLENERLIGIVSIGDVVKAMISEQEFIIEQLELYITGSSQ